MIKQKTFSAIIFICLSIQTIFATNPDTTYINFQQQKVFFNSAKNELENMLSGKQTLDYERAVFITENAYWDNSFNYSSFQKVLNYHLESIKQLYLSNNTKSETDFKADWFETAQIKKQKYETLLKNWAIYKYFIDTTLTLNNNTLNYHLPFAYPNDDPLATNNWANSQVFNLIGTQSQTGNCYALSSLYKIFAERLKTDAQIATAPGHIYIVHKDEKDITYNIELASKSFPGNGSEEVLTYTTDRSVKTGIAMRYLDLKQSIALNLIYLAKGYQNKFKNNTEAFSLDCAELALKYDSLNLNAMLLKAEVLEEKVILKNKTITQLQSDRDFKEYEKLIAKLYNLGYREMPIEMQNVLISTYRKDNAPIIITDHTPSASKSLGVQHDIDYITLSNGVFDEMHEKKDIEKYSHIIFDTNKNKIIKFVTKDSTYNNYNFDPVVFAWNVDPMTGKYPHMSPYTAFENNPVYFNDPTGGDADVTIIGNTIYVTAKIKIYGSGASAAKAGIIQKDIMGKWQGNHPYTDSKGNVYNVKFSANVTVVPFVNPYTAGATDNFIEVNDIERSYVSGGNKGVWGANASAGTYAHEYGHLIGLTDGYIDTWLQTDVQGEYALSSNVGENYAPNDVMANHMGVVTKDNVSAVADYITQNIRKVQGPLATTGQLKFGNSPLGPGLTAKDFKNANPPPLPDPNSGDKTLQYSNGGGSSQPEAASREEARSEYKFDGE